GPARPARDAAAWRHAWPAVVERAVARDRPRPAGDRDAPRQGARGRPVGPARRDAPPRGGWRDRECPDGPRTGAAAPGGRRASPLTAHSLPLTAGRRRG